MIDTWKMNMTSESDTDTTNGAPQQQSSSSSSSSSFSPSSLSSFFSSFFFFFFSFFPSFYKCAKSAKETSSVGLHTTMGQNNQKSRCKYWATCSSVRSFACSTLLASLACSTVLTHLLARSLRSLLSSWENE